MTRPRGLSRRRLDLAGLALLLLGLLAGALSYWLISEDGANPLVIVPSTVAVMTGLRHVTKMVWDDR